MSKRKGSPYDIYKRIGITFSRLRTMVLVPILRVFDGIFPQRNTSAGYPRMKRVCRGLESYFFQTNAIQNEKKTLHVSKRYLRLIDF